MLVLLWLLLLWLLLLLYIESQKASVQVLQTVRLAMCSFNFLMRGQLPMYKHHEAASYHAYKQV